MRQLTPGEQLAGALKELLLLLTHMDREHCLVGGDLLERRVLRPLLATLATFAFNSGLWVLGFLMGSSPLSGALPIPKVKHWTNQEEPIYFTDRRINPSASSARQCRRA